MLCFAVFLVCLHGLFGCRQVKTPYINVFLDDRIRTPKIPVFCSGVVKTTVI